MIGAAAQELGDVMAALGIGPDGFAFIIRKSRRTLDKYLTGETIPDDGTMTRARQIKQQLETEYEGEERRKTRKVVIEIMIVNS